VTNGVLVIDKPAGPTSHDVVARVRRAIGIRRIGHTGTLDPLATGVLPLVIGRATRLAQYFAAREKAYDADIALGVATETDDATGRARDPVTVGASSRRLPRRVEVEEALSRFRGSLLQTPPDYSAKRVDGERAYRLARQRVPVRLEPVPVTVYDLTLLEVVDSIVRLRLTCSAGFYVRALARDLGAALGLGGRLERLRRTRSGEFTLDHTSALEAVEEGGRAALEQVIPMNRLLTSVPGLVLTATGLRRASHGNDVAPEHLTQPSRAGHPSHAGNVRLLDEGGELVAIAEACVERGVLRPVVVLV
jgi:tRNA pseudouridine55 synthase